MSLLTLEVLPALNVGTASQHCSHFSAEAQPSRSSAVDQTQSVVGLEKMLTLLGTQDRMQVSGCSESHTFHHGSSLGMQTKHPRFSISQGH